MDLLFKRYANPFPFMDGMIQTRRLCHFVDTLIAEAQKENEQKTRWDFYLHRVFDVSFNEFCEDLNNNKKNQSMSEQTMETTVKHSMNILMNYSPESGGEK